MPNVTPSMKTIPETIAQAKEKLHSEWPLADSTAITAGDWVRLEQFLDTFATDLIEAVRESVVPESDVNGTGTETEFSFGCKTGFNTCRKRILFRFYLITKKD